MTYVNGPADDAIGGTNEEAAAKQLTSFATIPPLGDIVMFTSARLP